MAVTWMCLIVLAMCLETNAGSFSLVVPVGPISAPLGGSVVLPSVVSPAFDPEEIRWYRPGQRNNPVLQYKKRKAQGDTADPRYRGRVFFTEGLNKGDVSLRLRNLELADRGQYVCYAHDGEWYEEANVSLTVRVTGSVPVMSSSATETGTNLNVSCVSDGWIPEPTVTWRDKNNNKINQNSNQVYFHDDAGFVRVSSWMLYSSSESEWLSCSVGVSDQERREGRILPTKNIIHPGYLTIPLVFAVLVILMLIIGIFILYKKGLIQFAVASKTISPPGEMSASEHDEEALPLKDTVSEPENEAEEKTTNTEKEETESHMEKPRIILVPEWESLQKSQVKSITLNNATAPDNLTVSGGKKNKFTRVNCPDPQEVQKAEDKFPLVLSSESFESGQHYWVVMLWRDYTELQAKKSWFVGVCRDPADQTQRFPLTPQNGFWGLKYEKETELSVNTDNPTAVPMPKDLRTVGVFLDCDKHTLSFYNVRTHSHLCTVEGVLSNKLFAVISPGVRDKLEMKICVEETKGIPLNLPRKKH